jgi:uncharacterized protein (DUF1684 family)
MKLGFRLLLFFCFILLAQQELNAQVSKRAYKKEIELWDTKRIDALKAANGWVNLAGLFWLKEGKNNFGSDSTNDIIFSHSDFPKRLGTFVVSSNRVDWITAEGNDVMLKDKHIQNLTVFHTDSASNPSLSYNTFKWNVIKRENKIGIRFRDLNSPALNALTHINRYAIDPKWNISAVFEPSLYSTIAITNVLGQTTQQQSPGKLRFSINNVSYTLDALDEGTGDLFVIFGDNTNGLETYDTGRFMYVPKPDENGITYIDFNKAFNPPCAFTTFATCPIPPKQNILPIDISAGEKSVSH